MLEMGVVMLVLVLRFGRSDRGELEGSDVVLCGEGVFGGVWL